MTKKFEMEKPLHPAGQQEIASEFSGILNKTIFPEGKTPFIQIQHDGRLHQVHVARSPTDLEKVKNLDDEAFGKFVGVGLEELRDISEHGQILMLFNDSGELIGESQILTSPIVAHANMNDTEAYCYRTAIKPGQEGKGYAQIFFKAQEVIAREAGKDVMRMTVRMENARSVRARLHAGFRIVDYDPNVYGSKEEGGARLIMEKSLRHENFPFDSRSQVKRVVENKTPIITKETAVSILSDNPAEIAFFVQTNTNKLDLVAHDLVAHALSQGYIGTGLIAAQEYGGNESSPSIFIFQKEGSIVIERLTLPIHLPNEYGRLREVVVAHSPHAFLITPTNAINKVAETQIGNVDAIAAHDEHQALVEALKKEGVNVVCTSALSFVEGRTAIFTRDPAFALGEHLVVGKMKRDTRTYETEGMIRFSNPKELIDMSSVPELVMEGGDIIYLGDHLILVGLGQQEGNGRTNEVALNKLAETFPEYKFVGVQHHDLHLDVLCSVVGHKKILADVTKLPSELITWLRKEKGFTVVVADPNEQIALGCNVIAVDDNRVIAVEQNKITNQRLRENGVTVIEVNMENVIKKGGGPRCLTCPTNRD